jgi:hypothetical protein
MAAAPTSTSTSPPVTSSIPDGLRVCFVVVIPRARIDRVNADASNVEGARIIIMCCCP